MKVLILSHSSDLAGAEQSMIGLFDYWSKTTDIQPEFIIRRPIGELASALKKRGFSYHALYYTNWAQRNPSNEPLEIYWYAKQNSKAVAKIEKLIEETKPNIVMTNTIVAPWAAIAAYNQKVPHVWFIREFGDSEDGFKFKMGRDKTFKTIGSLSDLVVANSETLRTFAAKYINKAKISVLYPPLDLNEIDRMAKAKIKTPFKDLDSLKLVITGRISASKGQAIAAEAVGILNNQGINCELCIVGSPSDKDDDKTLNSVIEKYDIADKVHLVGYQPNPLAYVNLADIGITASDKEAFGRVTLEYMALGKPVIGANAGATPEIVKPNNNGFLFRAKDPNDLGQVLLKYANNKQLIHKHGKAAKHWAQLLMQSKHTPEELYKKLIEISVNKTSLNKQPSANTPKWNSYPVMIDPDTEKPASRYSLRGLFLTIKYLLKSVYIHLK